MAFNEQYFLSKLQPLLLPKIWWVDKRQIDQLAKQNQTTPLSASIFLVASIFYIENELIGTSKNCCNQ